MNRLMILTTVVLLSTTNAFGQIGTVMHKNTIRLGIDWFGLPESTGFHYQAQYSRHLHNDRWVVTASTGYMKSPNSQDLLGTNLTYPARPTKRITLDAVFAYDFLSSHQHALRFGIGPSVWYREDEKIRSAYYRIYSDGTVDNVKIDWEREQGMSIGSFGQFDYEYYLPHRTTVGIRLAFGGLTGHNGIVTIMGATVGYRL